MKLIPLTQGKFAQVDDEDYDFLMQWKWWAHTRKGSNTFYAIRNTYIKGKQISIKMHRLLLGLTDEKILVDHRDGDGLNNQRLNLRSCSKAQNNFNTKSRKKSTSSFLGVSYKTSLNKWVAQIQIESKQKHLGVFPYTKEGEISAAKIYDMFAEKYFGEFANLNFKK